VARGRRWPPSEEARIAAASLRAGSECLVAAVCCDLRRNQIFVLRHACSQPGGTLIDNAAYPSQPERTVRC
jgi:hypothetical protein